ncbi:MAG: alkaline phosphatase D family protein [Candidatus Nanopelagicales bacterium]
MTDDTSTGGLDRRSFIALGAAATGAVLVPATPALAGRSVRASGPVFTLGVASGDPLPDSVILWTRLAPQPLELDGGMGETTESVEWEIASDDAFRNVVARGTEEATPVYGHSVHVDVKGLTPDSWYYYRFKHGSEISPVGRTRTTPEFGASMSRLVVGQTSCANWQSGYYQLYADLAAQEPDYWLALGDYMYEYGNKGYLRPTQTKPTRSIPWEGETHTIWQYRRQYGLYRGAQELQDLHAAAPYSVIWDDHEVDNNFTASKSGGDGQKDRVKFYKRRAAGFQAFWENHAIRIPTPDPRPKRMKIYREVTWGTLATFLMLDGRQYRSDQPGDNTPNDFGKWVKGMVDPRATMLGPKQEAWLGDRLADSTSKWTFMAQQTVVSDINGSVGLGVPVDGLYNYDSWDGYWAARDRLASAITQGQVRNPVILTGDFHCNLAFDVLAEWPDPQDFGSMAECIAATQTWDKPAIAAEFAAGAISSPTFFGEGGIVAAAGPPTLAKTPWAEYGELLGNGYVLHEITPEADRANFRVCQANYRASTAEGKPRLDKTVVVADGVPGISEVL